MEEEDGFGVWRRAAWPMRYTAIPASAFLASLQTRFSRLLTLLKTGG